MNELSEMLKMKGIKKLRQFTSCQNTPFAFECVLLCDGKYHFWKDDTSEGLCIFHPTEPLCNCKK